MKKLYKKMYYNKSITEIKLMLQWDQNFTCLPFVDHQQNIGFKEGRW